MPIKLVKIEYNFALDDETDNVAKVIGDSLKSAAAFWHRNYLQKHFTPAGASEYGYQKRTPNYLKRKFRKKGHQDPLVWSGTLRSMVMGQIARPSVKRDGDSKFTANIVLKVPPYTFVTKTKSGTPSPPKYNELITTSEREAEVLSRIVAEETNRIMDEQATRTTAKRF